MNIVQAKQIQLEDFLGKLGFQPAKTDNNSFWYYSPFRKESTPSFNVNVYKRVWFDHGLGKGGNIIDLAMALYQSDDIHYLLKQIEKLAPAMPSQRYQVESYRTDYQPTFSCVEVLPLTTPQLLSYLSSRGIDYKVAMEQCKEIHYRYNMSQYYAVAFENIHGGYEIRNPYFKGCISPKSISVIMANDTTLCDSCCVFEGFVDFLSYLTLKKQITDFTMNEKETDYIVLNSVSQINKALPELEKYKQINCYLDNDQAGIAATDLIVGSFADRQVNNISLRYEHYNDLNDFLMRKRKD
ncbi:hypothetical protein HMPREF1214_02108 [Bacteroides sp. HPS0048]|uniref:toprim domain-containing protein n=1 Tax=Bacteroides sp. HPS0048 TaxID=1078089 RepID=UPI00036976C0|nr:toprim domain-containing protein [Bacteroides sp. HPS0048]EOA58536.1 hypothetical protein HMPREF1214_02108 [Bacteroides sp. HPS0048]